MVLQVAVMLTLRAKRDNGGGYLWQTSLGAPPAAFHGLVYGLSVYGRFSLAIAPPSSGKARQNEPCHRVIQSTHSAQQFTVCIGGAVWSPPLIPARAMYIATGTIHPQLVQRRANTLSMIEVTSIRPVAEFGCGIAAAVQRMDLGVLSALRCWPAPCSFLFALSPSRCHNKMASSMPLSAAISRSRAYLGRTNSLWVKCTVWARSRRLVLMVLSLL